MPQLTWLGDTQAKRAAQQVPYRLLETASEHGDLASPNWLIQGDNLDALKALLPFYAGRVKCIVSVKESAPVFHSPALPH